MADYADVRQRIIASIFAKRGSGNAPDETYVAHLKIWEESDQGQKARYIIISSDAYGGAAIHKSKENSNGTFSIGKTWKIDELRGFEVIAPTQLKITFARTYTWVTQSPQDQTTFVHAAVGVYRQVTGSSSALRLVNCPEDHTTSMNGSSSSPPKALRNGSSGGGPSYPVGVGRSLTQSAASSSRGYGEPPMSPPSSRLGVQRAGTQISSPPSRSRDPSPRPMPPSDAFTSARAASPANGYTPPVNGDQSPRRTPLPLRQSDGPGARPSPQLRHATPAYSDRSAQPVYPERTGTPRISVPERMMSPPPPRRGSPVPRDTQSSFASTTFSDRTSASRGDLTSAYTQSSISERMMPSYSEESLPTRRAPSPQPPPVPTPAPEPDPPAPLRAREREREREREPVTNAAAATPPARTRTPSERSNTPRLPVAKPSLPRLDAPKEAAADNARISAFDPANQGVTDRLLSANPVTGDGNAEESAEATMANVEEMLEGYEWASGSVLGAGSGRSKGAADQIEARLLDELLALERANIHSFLETDDRITTVLQYINDAIEEVNTMDSQVMSYKVQLNAVSEDIAYIQSQNRGLQVQTQNQRLLLTELEKLLQTAHVDTDVLYVLTQVSLESGIEQLEDAAAELYKALQAGRDTDMAATMERLDEYRTHNSQFCTRLLDFLPIMFKFQADKVLTDNSKGRAKSSLSIPAHSQMHRYLLRYSRLLHYVKEMDEPKYAKICEAYFQEASDLHSKEIKDLLLTAIGLVKKVDDDEASFTHNPNPGPSRAETIRRVGHMVRSPLERKEKESKPGVDGEMRASEAFQIVLEQIAPQIRLEQDFISEFLHINDAGVSFADVMNLDSYFRRQAARGAGLSPSTVKIVRGALDTIFSFLRDEVQYWIDGALQRDALQIVGILASLDKWTTDADSADYFFSRMLQQKIQQRLRGQFDRQVADQVKAIEQTKLTAKKRTGVAQFIKFFPVFVLRIETQLAGADTYEIRRMVDAAYERLVQSMLDCLKTMAKLEGDSEDKGQLNHHVILIENMHYFIHELTQQQVGSVRPFIRKAEGIYEENLAAYVKLVIRRPFSKILDYFDGVERLVQNSGPTSVAGSSNYNKSALKRVLKDYNSKDVRKHIEALFKRVNKHFGESDDEDRLAPGTVEMGVWKACEDDVARNTERFAKLIAQCYPDTGLGLEYALSDVEQSFKKHRMGS